MRCPDDAMAVVISPGIASLKLQLRCARTLGGFALAAVPPMAALPCNPLMMSLIRLYSRLPVMVVTTCPGSFLLRHAAALG